MKRIATVSPYMLDGYLIIALDPEWVSVFGCVPALDVLLDVDGRLFIVSQKACLKQ